LFKAAEIPIIALVFPALLHTDAITTLFIHAPFSDLMANSYSALRWRASPGKSSFI
jgi:hypothetical protein